MLAAALLPLALSDSESSSSSSAGSRAASPELHFSESDGTAYDTEDELSKWDTHDQAKWQRVTEGNGAEYEVQDVLRWRRHPKRGHVQYRIKWQDYPPYENTWEPEENLKRESEWSGEKRVAAEALAEHCC